MRHVERRLKPEEFSAQLSFDVAEWCQFFTPSPKPVIQDTSKWKPPPDFVKINLDGAYYPESGTGGWGCIAGAPDGDILFAAAGPLSNLSEPLQAESNAILKAIDLSENLPWAKSSLKRIV